MNDNELVMLPTDQWVYSVEPCGMVLIAAHTRGGYLYWHKVPKLNR